MIHISLIPDVDDPDGGKLRSKPTVLFVGPAYCVSYETPVGKRRLRLITGPAQKVAAALRDAGYTVEVRGTMSPGEMDEVEKHLQEKKNQPSLFSPEPNGE